MIPTDKNDYEAIHRAVSPVIGVILMVAITVILAAVIGAFVLEIGDQQETAPSTSFSTEEESLYMNTRDGHPDDIWKVNQTLVSLTHAGGETLNVGNTELVIEGNDSVWGPTSNPPKTVQGSDGYYYPVVSSQPDVCRSAGTNTEAEFSSGDTWHALVFYNDFPPIGFYDNSALDDNKVICSNTYMYYIKGDGSSKGASSRIYSTDFSSQVANHWDILCQGDQVNVVWEASSGGKTQTLHKYTVQKSREFCGMEGEPPSE